MVISMRTLSMSNMTSLEWWQLYAAFCKFQSEAAKHNIYPGETNRIEGVLLEVCPIPQPQAMNV